MQAKVSGPSWRAIVLSLHRQSICMTEQFLKSEGEEEGGEEEGEHETLKTKKSPPLREGPN